MITEGSLDVQLAYGGMGFMGVVSPIRLVTCEAYWGSEKYRQHLSDDDRNRFKNQFSLIRPPKGASNNELSAAPGKGRLA